MLRPGLTNDEIQQFIDDIRTNWRPEWGDPPAWVDLVWRFAADIGSIDRARP